MEIIDKATVLAAYLSSPKNPVKEEDIDLDYDNYYSYGDCQYIILHEGNEEYDYLKSYSDDLTEQYKIDLENDGYSYIIPFIDFDKMFEDDNLIDQDFKEFTYENETYYIREE